MACLDHNCLRCGEGFYSNGDVERCPACGSTDFTSYWDEEGNDWEPTEDEDEQS